MSAGIVVVAVGPDSDGDASHRPRLHRYTEVNEPQLYLEKLGAKWMEHKGEAVPGITYVLDRLPAGYTVWRKARTKATTSGPRYDVWLYGHPTHRVFDSPNRYFPHFLHLMRNEGSNIGCECTVCQTKGGGRIPKMSASSSARPTPSAVAIKQKGRPKIFDMSRPSHRDEEGTPDVYRNLIDELRHKIDVDRSIEERMSMDWRTESKLVREWLQSLTEQQNWMPRRGEIVLFVRSLAESEEISLNLKTDQFVVYNTAMGEPTGAPKWEAGVVGQVSTEKLKINELVRQTVERRPQLNYSGFRVELLSDPACPDEKQFPNYKYVPLRQMRPFVFWNQYLSGIPKDDWSPTIGHALTVMSTFSLVDKYRFRGVWPSASIFCGAIYIGPELITVGDVIRIMSSDSKVKDVTQVMQVSSIQLKLTGLDRASSDDNDEGHPYNSAVRLTGKCWSLRQNGEGEMPDHVDSGSDPFFQHSLMKYGMWMLSHPPGKELQVPFHRVLGRCYEADAMYFWFPGQRDNPAQWISLGLTKMRQARDFSSRTDQRITDGKAWFWGDSRAESLGLTSVNGVEVSAYNENRDPGGWRKIIKVIDGIADEDEKRTINEAAKSARPLRAYGMPVAHLHNKPSIVMETESGSGSESVVMSSHKRTHSKVEIAGDEEDDNDYA